MVSFRRRSVGLIVTMMMTRKRKTRRKRRARATIRKTARKKMKTPKMEEAKKQKRMAMEMRRKI